MKLLLQIEIFLSKIGACLPFTYLVPPANKINRQEGISALVVVRDEPWLEPSLLSIKDLVDEYIVVDSSTINIKKTINKLIQQGLNIKYIKTKSNYSKQVATAVKLSTKKWLLRWDADEIAYTTEKKDIQKLKKVISTLNPVKYYAIFFNILNVDFDFFHTEKLLHKEPYFFSYSNMLQRSRPRLLQILVKLIRKKRPPRIPFMPFPLWYERIVLEDIFVLHLRTIKPLKRLLERPCQPIWALATGEIRAKYSNSYDEFIKHMQTTKGEEMIEMFCPTIWSLATDEFKAKYSNSYDELVKRVRKLKGNAFFEEIFIKRIKSGLSTFDKDKYGYPYTLELWIRENLHTEIEDTVLFDNKIKEFLNKGVA